MANSLTRASLSYARIVYKHSANSSAPLCLKAAETFSALPIALARNMRFISLFKLFITYERLEKRNSSL